MSNTNSSQSSSSSVDSSKVQKESPVKIDKIAQTAERAERNARLRAEAEQVVADRQVASPKVQKEAQVKTNKPAQKKTVKVMPLCGCGCGVRTGGGIFRPGHDAKLKSQLFAASRAGNTEATAELAKRGWLWLMAAPKVKVAVNRTRAELEDDSVFLAQLATMPEDGSLTI